MASSHTRSSSPTGPHTLDRGAVDPKPTQLSFRTFWSEPRIPDPPGPMARDFVLVALLASVAVGEVLVRDDIVWPGAALGFALLAIGLLPWRRVQPMATSAVVFGSIIGFDLIAWAVGAEFEGMISAAAVLLYPYALFRWAAGREAALGLGLMLAVFTVDLVTHFPGFGDTIGGLIVFLFPAELGAVIRFWGVSRAREIEQVRHRERELLARELHDTVAHHVSAIVIQAQAGRTVAGVDPSAAMNALEVIEEEAARTLTEMRAMIGTLRDDGGADLAPQQGVMDIAGLADSSGGPPTVRVELGDGLDGLRPSIGAALYRLAQESVTNAVRHARYASLVEVVVQADEDLVTLTVTDDGQSGSYHGGASGFGIVGMNERAALHGGTLEAGPDPDGGWTVRAVLPRRGPVK